MDGRGAIYYSLLVVACLAQRRSAAQAWRSQRADCWDGSSLAPDIMALVWLQPSFAAARRAPVLTALCAATSALATAVLLRAQISPAVAVVAAAAAARPEAPTVSKGSKGTTGSQVHSL
eukprot:COSAG01_NODE_43179_length_432_cov_1.381381_1_plen_118_part_10